MHNSNNEIIEQIKEVVFNEIRGNRIGVNEVWRFQQYNSFVYDRLSPIQRDCFIEAMDELCAEEVFKYEEASRLFRLTEHGANIVYSNNSEN